MADEDDGLGIEQDNFDTSDESDIETFFPERNDEDIDGEEETVDPYAWAANDPELYEYAQSKGMKDPAAALKSYRESETRMRQIESDLQRERQMREMAEEEAMRRAEQQYGGGDQDIPDDPDELLEQQFMAIEQAYTSGQIDNNQRAVAQAQATRQYTQAMRDSLRSEVLAEVDQQYAPVADSYAVEKMNSKADEMMATYGKPIGDRAIRIWQERGLPNSADGIEMAFEIAAGQYYAERRATSQRANMSETMDGGGRVPMRSGPSAEEVMLKRIMGAGGRKGDGLG